jgi:hypothetical protein
MHEPPAPHSLEAQQSPSTQVATPPSPPPQQRPAPHCESSLHGWQVPTLATPPSRLTQVLPPHAALTGLAQHSPVPHTPAQQRSPSAHSRSEAQALHWEFVHTCPASQSDVAQQSP